MKELGEYLKSERLNKELTLSAVNERTRISPRMLEDIEAGNFEKLGAPVLIRGFLRLYCREVGIDWEPILEEYDRKICECDCSKESYQQFQRWLKPFRKKSRVGVFVLLLLVVGTVGFLFAKDWISQRKALLSSAPESMRTDTYPQQEKELLSDLTSKITPSPETGIEEEVAAKKEEAPLKKGESDQPSLNPIAMFTKKETKTETQEKPPETVKPSEPSKEANKVSKPKPKEGASPVKPQTKPQGEKLAEIREVVAPAPAPKHQLFVVAQQETWIQVSIDDGKRVQGVLLKPGEKRQWEGDDNMEIVVGNAGGIRLTWDGKPLKPLGKSGQVVHLNLPDSKYLE
jgi:cytoskeletal protein RodZ